MESTNPWIRRPETDPPTPASFEPAQPEPLAPPFETKRPNVIRRTLGPALATIIAFAAKFKSILLLLPKLKMFSTAGTMLVSIAAYALFWGFPFAVGLVVLLLIHELGHVIALRREGIKASAPMFVPFLGALITAKSLGENATAEARVGLAGPILGSIGAAACVVIWYATGNDMWRALAFTGFFLNLLNLVPVSPFDGGRAMAAMAPWMWAFGLAIIAALIVTLHSAFLLIFLIVGGMDSWRRWRAIRQGGAEQVDYYRVKPVDRLLVAAVYVSLIALLVAGMNAAHLPRTIS
jgi:Zn-dependent protease